VFYTETGFNADNGLSTANNGGGPQAVGRKESVPVAASCRSESGSQP